MADNNKETGQHQAFNSRIIKNAVLPCLCARSLSLLRKCGANRFYPI